MTLYCCADVLSLIYCSNWPLFVVVLLSLLAMARYMCVSDSVKSVDYLADLKKKKKKKNGNVISYGCIHIS